MNRTARRSLVWLLRALLLAAFFATLAILVDQLDQTGDAIGEMMVGLLLPVGIVFFGLALLVEVFSEEIQEGALHLRVRRLLYWMPRVLTLIFALFISLFALDVFGQGYGFWGTLTAFAMHMIPTALLLLALAIAWRWEWIGGLMAIGLALLYVVWMRAGPWTWHLIIAGPLVVLGLLFLANWGCRRELHPERWNVKTF